MISNKIKILFIIICLLTALSVTIPARAVTPIPRRTTPTTRVIYVYTTPAPIRRYPLRQPVKKQSFLQQLWNKIGPAILGSGGIILGAVVAWYTLRRKTKALDGYFDRVAQAQAKYTQAIATPGIDKTKARTALKADLTNIQEEVEMAVARKKLDQEQLIAVSNKISRILETRS